MTSTPSNPGDLCAQAMDSASRFVNAIRPDQWHDSTPCEEWDLRALVAHITDEALWAAELFAGKTMDEVGDRLDGDPLGDDPIASFNAALAAAREAVLKPGTMDMVCHLSFGDFPGSEYASQLFLDYLVHGWDVAKGSGQDPALELGLVEACIPFAERWVVFAKEAEVFADSPHVAAGASAQDRLLAIVGRRGSWSA